MNHKREQAKAAAAQHRAEKEAKRAEQEALDDDELMPALRNLGLSKEQARFALKECGPAEGQTMEMRIKKCLASMLPPHRKVSPVSLH